MWGWISAAALTVSSLSAVYLAHRLTAAFRLRRTHKVLAWLILLLAGPVLLVVVKTQFYSSGRWRFVVGVLIAMVVGAALAFLMRAAGALARRRTTSREKQPLVVMEQPPANVGRRDALAKIGVTSAIGLGVGVGGYAVLFAPSEYEVTELAVPVPALPRTLDGYRVAQISDIHFGSFVGPAERRVLVEVIRRLSPDLVVLTGDLVDYDPAYTPELGRLIRGLSDLALRDGVVAISGNHDYYTGIERVVETCIRGGARMLRNEGEIIGEESAGFALLGVDYGPDADFRRAASMVPPDLPRVLLCHDPAFFPAVRGEVALQLSGHTHGGQIAPFGMSPGGLLLPYNRGLYIEEGSQLYVNRGFGTAVVPARVGCPPEVTLVSLVSV